MKGLANDLPKALVLRNSRRVNKRIYLPGIWFFIRQTILVDICLKYLANDQHMAPQIQRMDDLAFQINRAFPDERSSF